MFKETTSNKKILSNSNKKNDGNILMGRLISNIKIVLVDIV